LYRYFVSQYSEFCRHNPLCCFSTSVYCCKLIYFVIDSVRKLLDTTSYKGSINIFNLYLLIFRTKCTYYVSYQFIHTRSVSVIILFAALGPTQPPIQWVLGALSLGVKQPGCEADNSPPSSAEGKNTWSYTSTLLIRLHGVVLS
jgi:hypothetical protein